MQAWQKLVANIVQSGKVVCAPMMDVCRFAGMYDWAMSDDIKFPILVHMSSSHYSSEDLYVFISMLAENGIHSFVISETSSYCNELICTILANNVGHKEYRLSITEVFNKEIKDRYGHIQVVNGPIVNIRKVKRKVSYSL